MSDTHAHKDIIKLFGRGYRVQLDHFVIINNNHILVSIQNELEWAFKTTEWKREKEETFYNLNLSHRLVNWWLWVNYKSNNTFICAQWITYIDILNILIYLYFISQFSSIRSLYFSITSLFFVIWAAPVSIPLINSLILYLYFVKCTFDKKKIVELIVYILNTHTHTYDSIYGCGY